MGIETRKGRLYWYRRERINGKLRGVYLFPHCAFSEQLFGEQLELNRLRREQAKNEVEEVAGWAAGVLEAGAAFDQLADRVFRATMYLTGHSLHKRSEWRRKHGAKAMARSDDLLRVPSQPEPALVKPRSADPAVQRVLDRAAMGDQSILPAVKKLLTGSRPLAQFASVARWAKVGLVRAAAGDDLALTEAVSERLDEHVEKLLADGGPKPTVVEWMAATRVAHNWLAVHILETKLAGLDAGSRTAAAIDKQLCRAERRLQAGLKSLAVLRRLRRPVLVAQVNEAPGTALVTHRVG